MPDIGAPIRLRDGLSPAIYSRPVRWAGWVWRCPISATFSERRQALGRHRPPMRASSFSCGVPKPVRDIRSQARRARRHSRRVRRHSARTRRAYSSANTSPCSPSTRGCSRVVRTCAQTQHASPVGGIRGADRLPAQPRCRQPHRHASDHPNLGSVVAQIAPGRSAVAGVRPAAAARDRRWQPDAWPIRRLPRPAIRSAGDPARSQRPGLRRGRIDASPDVPPVRLGDRQALLRVVDRQSASAGAIGGSPRPRRVSRTARFAC